MLANDLIDLLVEKEQDNPELSFSPETVSRILADIRKAEQRKAPNVGLGGLRG
jgi:hypothetical protein